MSTLPRESTNLGTTEPIRVVRPAAVIDIGTSSIRMAIAEIDSAGGVRTLETLSQAVNLGRDTFTKGSIEKATIEKCVEILKSYRQRLREYQNLTGRSNPCRCHERRPRGAQSPGLHRPGLHRHRNSGRADRRGRGQPDHLSRRRPVSERGAFARRSTYDRRRSRRRQHRVAGRPQRRRDLFAHVPLGLAPVAPNAGIVRSPGRQTPFDHAEPDRADRRRSCGPTPG